VTVPGPLNLLHVVVTLLPTGNPSSVAVPDRLAPAGNVIVEPVPALTFGAVFPAGFAMIVTSEKADSAVSLAVNRKTYVPDAENVAVVASAFAFPNVTVPGPLNLLQVVVTLLPTGNPSSVAVPDKLAPAGNVIVEPVPAFTFGAVFAAGFTTIVTLENADSTVSLAVSRNT
jgi:hypothetical protein